MRYSNIIGRETEITILERIFKSKKSEFIAIYGRRREGKSFLVNEYRHHHKNLSYLCSKRIILIKSLNRKIPLI